MGNFSETDRSRSTIDRVRVVMVLAAMAVGAAVGIGNIVDAQVLPVTISVAPSPVQSPGSSTARVTLNLASGSDLLTVVATGGQAQLGQPSVFNGGWIPSCSGLGTNSISCAFTSATYPLVLDVPVTVPTGVDPTTWSITATIQSSGAAALGSLVIQAAATTTTPTTTSTTVAGASTTTVAGASTTTVAGAGTTTVPRPSTTAVAAGAGGATTTVAGTTLPATGPSDNWTLSIIALIAIAAGAGLIVLTRRRDADAA